VIVDGFIFYNETDILRMRLEELYPVVDKFVIVQAHKTFRGQDKPLYLSFDDEWLAPYRDKLVLCTIDFPDHLTDPWGRETYQRNFIWDAMQDWVEPSDIIIISDVDEIPRRSIVEWFAKNKDYLPVQLHMPMYYYGLNVRIGDWYLPKIIRAGSVTSPQQLRHTQYETIPDAGWHFSYMGDAEFIRNKIKSFSHYELDTPEIHAGIEQAMAEVRDPFGRDIYNYRVEQIDDTWPEAVNNNPDYWSKYVW
jgi:hypothetical protein